MPKYILKRILIAIPVLLGITVIDYALCSAAGNPLAMMMTAGLAVADTTYTGVADSQIGGVESVKVTVTLADDGSLASVVVDQCKDTAGICELPCEKLPSRWWN